MDRAVLDELDRRLQYGSGMRVQRMVEAAFLLAAFFLNDIRFAYVTFGSTLLQALSPRLVPVALLVAALTRLRAERELSDLYFDLRGSQGACAISVVVQAFGLWLSAHGHASAGLIVLAIPTASFLLAPTVGFCCGCAVYVAVRDVLARLGVVKARADGACDVNVD